jgi:diacylglycerol kinase (ATP)
MRNMTDTSLIFAIVNSRAKLQQKNAVVALLRDKKIAYRETEWPLHATELARSASQYEMIMAIGGDGTIHEVINGIDTCKQSILPVPAGTLNGIVHQLGIRSIADAFDLIQNHSVQMVDLMEVEFRDYHGVTYHRRTPGFVSIGQDGRLTMFARKLKPLPALLRYLFAGLFATFTIKSVPAEIVINNEKRKPRRISSLTINNGAANFFTTIKHWDLQDGTVEVHIGLRSWLTQSVWNFLCLSPYSGAFEKKITSLSVQLGKPLPLMLDGEVFSDIVYFSMNIKPGALRMVLPEDSQLSR